MGNTLKIDTNFNIMWDYLVAITVSILQGIDSYKIWVVFKCILTNFSAKVVSSSFQNDGGGRRVSTLTCFFKMDKRLIILRFGHCNSQIRCSTLLVCSSVHLVTTLAL